MVEEAHFCTACQAPVGPEQHRCPGCHARLGFVPELGLLCAFEDRGEAGWHPLGVRGIGTRLPCGNYGEHPICHWTVPAEASDCYCESCRCMARTPNLAEPALRQRWARFGRARRRLFVELRQLGLLDARGHLRGLPEPLFDVLDAPRPQPDGDVVRVNVPGPILVDLSQIDAIADRDLFQALRRAIALRLRLVGGIALPVLPPPNPERFVVEGDAHWGRTGGPDPESRRPPRLDRRAGGAGLLA
jgi:hypothetical protein